MTEELASEVDGILDQAQTGLTYELAVHTRFSGAVWITQVRRRIGAVATSDLEQLIALAWNDEPEGISLRRGMPLQPQGIDPRFVPLAALSIEIDLLTEHCRRRRFDPDS